LLRKVPRRLLMLFGTLLLSVGNTSPNQSVLTDSSLADFESAFLFVMRHEDPRLIGIITVDQGGRTRFGVSEKAHPEAWKNGPPSFDDALKLAQVEFWDRHSLAGVNSQEVANYILDMIYNEGPGAIRMVQVALNDFEFVAVDGGLGAQTLAAINRQEPAAFLRALSHRRKLFYKHLADAKRVNARWLPIWLERAADGVPKPQS
jgi:predicted peptidoglycan binding protein/glycosyl hydrolase family 108